MSKAGSHKAAERKLWNDPIAVHTREFHRKNPGVSPRESANEIIRACVLKSPKGKKNPEWIVNVFTGMVTESDRGFVLVAASVIDEELKRLLMDFFKTRSHGSEDDVKFFFEGQVPPLQSTSNKIKLAHILGLVDQPLRSSLLALQKIRSQVAAHSRTSFVITMQHAKLIYDKLGNESKDALGYCYPNAPEGDIFRLLTIPRAAFIAVSMAMLTKLASMGKSVRRKLRHFQSKSGSADSAARRAKT
jgi:hypothetical protein